MLSPVGSKVLKIRPANSGVHSVMRLAKILVPIDFSASSTAAVDYATILALGSGAALIFAHVAVPSPDFAAPPDSAEGRPYALASQQDPGEATLDQVVPTASGVSFTHRLLEGDPAEELLALATQEQVGLIVMGTHGHTALSKLLLGSVAEAIVHRAPCPGITLKLPRNSSHN